MRSGQDDATSTCHDIGSIAGQPNRREPAQDARAFVLFPEPMQEHMLGNMRDHLVTLNEILATLPTANTRLRSLLNKSWE